MKMAGQAKYEIDLLLNVYSGTKEGIKDITNQIRAMTSKLKEQITKAKGLDARTKEFKNLHAEILDTQEGLDSLYSTLKKSLGVKKKLDFIKDIDKNLALEDTKRSLLDYRLESQKLLEQNKKHLLTNKKLNYQLLPFRNNLKRMTLSFKKQILKSKELDYKLLPLKNELKEITLAHQNQYKELARTNAELLDYKVETNKITKEYQKNLLYAKEWNAKTAKAQIFFKRFFGIGLSTMFLFRQLSNSMFGFIRQSINGYMNMVSQTDAVYKSIMQLKGGFESLRYSFVQAMDQAGIFDTLANIVRSVVTWFENLTPKQQQTIVKFTLLGAVIFWVLSAVGQLLVYITSLKMAFNGAGSAGAAAAGTSATGWAIAIGVIAALVFGFIYNFKKAMLTLSEHVVDIGIDILEAVDGILDSFLDIYNSVVAVMTGNWKDAIGYMRRSFANFLKFFQEAANVIKHIIEGISDVLIDSFNGIIKFINKILHTDLPQINIKKKLPDFHFADDFIKSVEDNFELKPNITFLDKWVDKLKDYKSSILAEKEALKLEQPIMPVAGNTYQNNNVSVNINFDNSTFSGTPTPEEAGELLQQYLDESLKRVGIGHY